MKLYADAPRRRLLQLTGDLLFVLWVVGWIWVAMTVYDNTVSLAAPGTQIESSSTRLGEALDDAGSAVAKLPVVGSQAAEPFAAAGDATDGIADAGAAFSIAVERLAFWLGISIGAIPILLWASFYVPPRLRFVQEATAGRRFVDAGADLDLFALRALAHQPMHVLARISDDPAGDWRAADQSVIRQLADLELRKSGLRPRRLPSAATG